MIIAPPNSGSERIKSSNHLPFSQGFDKCLDNLKKLNSNELKLSNTQSLIEQLGPDISHLIKNFAKENEAPKEKIINFDFKEPTPINISSDYQFTSPNTVISNVENLTENSQEKTVSENLESNEEEIIDVQETILSSTAFTQTISTQNVTETPNADTLKRKRSKNSTKQQKLEDTIDIATQNSQNSDVNLESDVVKKIKGSNLKKDSILYGDNLLKELLCDRNVIVKAYEKNMSKRKVKPKSEEILTKTCIKR